MKRVLNLMRNPKLAHILVYIYKFSFYLTSRRGALCLDQIALLKKDTRLNNTHENETFMMCREVWSELDKAAGKSFGPCLALRFGHIYDPAFYLRFPLFLTLAGGSNFKSHLRVSIEVLFFKFILYTLYLYTLYLGQIACSGQRSHVGSTTI